jgi:transposase
MSYLQRREGRFSSVFEREFRGVEYDADYNAFVNITRRVTTENLVFKGG